jgi:hypothetical protein
MMDVDGDDIYMVQLEEELSSLVGVGMPARMEQAHAHSSLKIVRGVDL